MKCRHPGGAAANHGPANFFEFPFETRSKDVCWPNFRLDGLLKKMGDALIFLSHSGEDTPAARELARLLSGHGLRVWLDVEQLTPGDRWGEKLEQALQRASTLIVYVGKSGVRRWVEREVRAGLERSVREAGFRLVPVLGPGSNPEDLPLFLNQYQRLDLRAGWQDAGQLRSLIEGATSRPAGNVSLLPHGRPPFQGLQPFDVEDSLIFFGRETEIEDLLDKLGTKSFLAVVGDSGSGKSSLVRAGLIPALYRGRYDGGRRLTEPWRVAIARPGEDPFGELAKALVDLKPEMRADEKLDFLQGLKHRLPRADGLDNAIAALSLPPRTRTLLVVDQFEELFTFTRAVDAEKERQAKEKRMAYVDALLGAARLESERPAHVVITLRADFYSHCWEHSQLTARLAANQYNVRRANRERLREAIEKPLAIAGASAEAFLVDEILDDVGDAPGNLPLLEHALSQLWDERENGVVTKKGYVKIGKLSGALQTHADRVLKGIGDENRGFARRVFVALTQLGDGTEDTRRRVKKSELAAMGSGSAAATAATDKIIKTLTDERLLTSSGRSDTSAHPAQADDVIEVSHEALIREWSVLRTWLNEGRDELLQERRLADAAAEWEKLKRDSGYLWSGNRLIRAEEWANRHEAGLSGVVREFLNASHRRALADARKAKRARLLISGLTALTILTVIGFLGWTVYEQRQREARLFEDSIVRDRDERLMWTRTDNLENISWNDAEKYCRDLRLGGFQDWHLPEIKQLRKLYDDKNGGVYHVRKPFRLTDYWVWSSEKEGSGSPYASGGRVYFNFSDGSGFFPLASSSTFRALCVRGSGE